MAWTDDRLDDTFRDLRDEIRAFRTEMHAEIGALRTELHTEIGALRTEVNELRSQMYRFGGGLLVAQFGLIAAMIGLIARG